MADRLVSDKREDSSMDCRAVVTSLSAYLDGWMSADDVRSIESHLVTCPKCQVLKIELSDIKSSSRELPLHTPSKALWKRIANEIELGSLPKNSSIQVPQESDSWWSRLKEREFTFSFPQLAGAGAVLVAFLIFSFLSFGSETSSRFNLSGV